MSEKMAAERELFESELRKTSAMTDHSEEYAFLALQRNSLDEYSTVWVQSAWMGWQMARAQPAEQASAGSIGDDDAFCAAMSAAIVCGKNGSHGLKEKIQAVIDAIDSHPRQADQQAPADTQGAGREREATDLFDGGDAALCGAINALLALDKAGALAPHGVGGHARTLLASASLRLDPATAGDCTLCDGMGMLDGSGATCPHCNGSGLEPNTVRDDALEDAAKACDTQAGEPECPERASYCAEAIRAMKSTAPKLAE